MTEQTWKEKAEARRKSYMGEEPVEDLKGTEFEGYLPIERSFIKREILKKGANKWKKSKQLLKLLGIIK